MQRRYTIAREAGIDRLYHFAAFDMARIYPIVAFNRLYFSRPCGFSDAWDCRPFFDIGRIDDSSWREETAQWLERLYAHGLSELTPVARERFRRLLRENGEILRRMVTEANAMAGWMNDVFRIFCLSAYADHPLNWALYTNRHTGVCLEFETSTVFFAEAAQVTYRDEYPAMPLKIKQEEDALLPILAKPSHWSYESEYRLIAQERSKKLNHQTLIADDHWVRFPGQSLKSIIVGCMMGKNEREAIKALVKHAPTPIALKQAIKVPSRYELRIVPLA
ncbi:DUF2971 domain-containing protein [Reyranella sp.]|jgi:hypothetical protein|uniref:DUF2971 domain-containing protein n=1 Tax=Reyranella sp. TaxID=1929291 RepID=UPI002F94B8EA